MKNDNYDFGQTLRRGKSKEILRSLRSLRMTGDRTVPSLIVRGQNFLKNVVNLEIRERVKGKEILRSLRSLRMTWGKGVNVFSLSKREGNKNLNELIKKHHFLTSLPTNLLTFKPAFTLAEVLITLGIIGIVAAITIPGLINAYRAQQLRAQFNKSYSIVQQAFKLMESDDVDTNMRNYNRTTNPFYLTFQKYLSQSTICGSYVDGSNVSNTKNPAGCYQYKISNLDDGYKYLNNNSFIGDGTFNNGQLMLPDGTLIFFDDSPEKEGWKGVLIFIDINGYKKGPNRLGYDFFAFEVIEGVVHAIGEVETSYKYNNDCHFGQGSGFTCSKRAKNESDYFKAIIKKIK